MTMQKYHEHVCSRHTFLSHKLIEFSKFLLSGSYVLNTTRIETECEAYSKNTFAIYTGTRKPCETSTHMQNYTMYTYMHAVARISSKLCESEAGILRTQNVW